MQVSPFCGSQSTIIIPPFIFLPSLPQLAKKKEMSELEETLLIYDIARVFLCFLLLLPVDE